jgi:hypothetical protein
MGPYVRHAGLRVIIPLRHPHGSPAMLRLAVRFLAPVTNPVASLSASSAPVLRVVPIGTDHIHQAEARTHALNGTLSLLL